jgi:hypothetical protein
MAYIIITNNNEKEKRMNREKNMLLKVNTILCLIFNRLLTLKSCPIYNPMK